MNFAGKWVEYGKMILNVVTQNQKAKHPSSLS